jgi:hypothetical protein
MSLCCLQMAKEELMATNVGNWDRVVRVVLGIGLLSLLFVLNGTVRWLGLIGVVPLVTGLFGFCPLYRLVGLSTCPLTAKK